MKKVLITGKDGLVGSSLLRLSNQYSKTFEFVFVGRNDYDLENCDDVKKLFNDHKPNYVINCAASVGGINLNITKPVDQFYKNVILNTLITQQCVENNVEKFINFSSICAFPSIDTALIEDDLQKFEPFSPHYSYGFSKRISDIQIKIIRDFNNLQYTSLIPVNIFGINDKYNIEYGHVIPSLIHKFSVNSKNNTPVEIFGDGTPKREFIFSDDLSKICFELLLLPKVPQRIIVSDCEEISIKEIVDKLSKIYDYYNINYNTNKPNGQLRRPTNNSLLRTLLPNFKFSQFDASLELCTEWFEKNYKSIRK